MMFKKFWVVSVAVESGISQPGLCGRIVQSAKHVDAQARRAGRLPLPYCLILLLAAGCALVPPMPKVDLKEPGWKTQEAQALYRPKKDAPEIVGELLIATKDRERTYVQFTKNPLPVAVAQSTPHKWEVELPMQNKRYSGHGHPPRRLIFLYLPAVLAGEPPPKGWTAAKLDAGGTRLENRKSGESLEVYLNDNSR